MPGLRVSPILTDRVRRFDAPVDDVWERLTAVDRYQTWWPWLQRLDADRLGDGARWACTVQPPLPYRVSFTLDLHGVVPCASVSATVGGDITGEARLDLRSLAPDGSTGTGSSELSLQAELLPASAFLQRLTRFAGPVARFGHDHVIDRALDQFADRGLA